MLPLTNDAGMKHILRFGWCAWNALSAKVIFQDWSWVVNKLAKYQHAILIVIVNGC
jgi:hypothetical protein